jgi:hypothetical protein
MHILMLVIFLFRKKHLLIFCHLCSLYIVTPVMIANCYKYTIKGTYIIFETILEKTQVEFFNEKLGQVF